MNNKPCILAMIASFVALGAARIESFCHLDSCQGQPHTLCQYSWLKVSKACGTVQRAGVTQSELDEIIDAHNEFRQRVASGQEQRGNPGPQPPAINMGQVVWDNDLAGVAQTWADQCLPGHDPCRNLPQYVVGQNIAWAGSTKKKETTLRKLIQGWYDEVVKVNRNMVSSYDDRNRELYGHYTQLVWAKSTKVGCGVVRYSTDNMQKNTYFVCNYGPAGNFNGEPIYETA